MLKNIEIKYYEKLSKYSTIKIGGNAKIMCFPKDLGQLKRCLAYAAEHHKKVFVLGNGSNTLFDDEGYDGMVINMKGFDKVDFHKSGVYVGAGVKLFVLNKFLAERGYTGLEWSYGIPGSVGGFIKMNGGSFGYEIADFIKYVDVYKNGKVCHLKRKDIDFSYRHSGIDGIILGAKFRLKKDTPDNIKNRMEGFFERKRLAQPYEAFSLGSVFKQIHLQNEVLFPAKMIDSLGLKGVKIGGVEVSRKHAGFVINSEDASSDDVKRMIDFLKEKVEKKYGVKLETEIVIADK